MAKTTGTLHIPGYKIDPRYVVRLQDGTYYKQHDGCGPDLNAVDAAHATQFLVRDGEWNADFWAKRLGGTVEVRS